MPSNQRRGHRGRGSGYFQPGGDTGIRRVATSGGTISMSRWCSEPWRRQSGRVESRSGQAWRNRLRWVMLVRDEWPAVSVHLQVRQSAKRIHAEDRASPREFRRDLEGGNLSPGRRDVWVSSFALVSRGELLAGARRIQWLSNLFRRCGRGRSAGTSPATRQDGPQNRIGGELTSDIIARQQAPAPTVLAFPTSRHWHVEMAEPGTVHWSLSSQRSYPWRYGTLPRHLYAECVQAGTRRVEPD
jgi:hypothetical protein